MLHGDVAIYLFDRVEETVVIDSEGSELVTKIRQLKLKGLACCSLLVKRVEGLVPFFF